MLLFQRQKEEGALFFFFFVVCLGGFFFSRQGLGGGFGEGWGSGLGQGSGRVVPTNLDKTNRLGTPHVRVRKRRFIAVLRYCCILSVHRS